ncbi:hypothetical protein LB503_010514 [Fusarium chuoi]|nr:hypothetical protein LB503_010514 [Fusarium chuoi]
MADTEESMKEVERDYVESAEVQAARRSLEVGTECLAERTAKLHQLANLLIGQPGPSYLHSFDEAICLKEKAIGLTPRNQQQAADLIDMASLNFARYSNSFCAAQSGASFLDESIRLQTDACQLPLSESESAYWLKDLGDYLFSRYKRKAMLLELDRGVRETNNDGDSFPTAEDPSKDLEDAITISKQAINMLRENDPVRATWFLHVGDLLGRRHDDTGEESDLEEALRLTRKSRKGQEFIEDEDANVPAQLSGLLMARYIKTRNSSDIEEAILLAREALSKSNPEERFFNMGLLSGALFHRHRIETSETMDYLDEATSLAADGLKEAEGAVQEIGASNWLYEVFCERYRISERMIDLGSMLMAAQTQKEAFFPGRKLDRSWRETVRDWWHHRVGEWPHSSDIKTAMQHPGCVNIYGSSQVASLDTLAHALYLMYYEGGAIGQLSEAIETMKELKGLLPRPQYLLNLGSYLLKLYDELHDPEMADEATDISQRLSSDLECQEGLLKFQYLRYKAAALSIRCHTSGDLGSLAEAINTGVQMTRTFLDDPRDRAGAFEALASGFYQMFCHTHLLSDLEKALETYKNGHDIMIEDDMNQAHYLRSYSRCYLERYRFTECPDDLNEAIRIGNQALVVSSGGIYLRERILNDVTTALYQRYLAFGSRDDLDEAIELGRKSVHLNQDPVSGYPSSLNLAAMLCEIHTLTDGEESRESLSEALKVVNRTREIVSSYEGPHPNLAGILCYCSSTNFIHLPGISGENAKTRAQGSQNILQTSDEMSCTAKLSHTSDLILMLSYSLLHEDSTNMDIDEPVRLGREALDIAERNTSPKVAIWHSLVLAIALGCRFTITNNAEDLIESLHLSQKSIETATVDDTHGPFYLMVYALGLYARYSATGRLADLHKCIDVSLQAWSISLKGTTSGDCHSQTLCSSNIARFLTDKYLREGLPKDLEQAIEFRQVSEDRLAALGEDESRDFYSKYTGSKNAEHVSNFGPMQTLYLTLHDNSNCPSRLYALSAELFRHYYQTRDSVSLSAAISFCIPCIDSTPRQHQQRPVRLELLGRCMESRYIIQKAGTTAIDEGRTITPRYMNDLNGSIRSLQEVIDDSSPKHPIWFSALHLLGPLYSDRYHISGDISDLKMSLILLHESVKATTPESDLLSNRLRHMAIAKMDNFALFNRQVDLESTKEILWGAMETIDQDSSLRVIFLLDLAAVYQADHRKTMSLHSLDTSLELFQETYKIMTSRNPHIQSHEYSKQFFSGRGLSYIEKFKDTKSETDFLKSVSSIGEATDIPKVSTREWVLRLLDLANVNIAAYRTPENKPYLDVARDHLKNAARTIELMLSTSDSTRAGLLFKVGNCYRNKYNAANMVSDLESAISFLRKAFDLLPLDTAGDLLMLITVAKSLISALEVKEDWDTAYEVVSRAIPLVATTTPRFLEISETQLLLSRYSNLASYGAALALSRCDNTCALSAFRAQDFASLPRPIQQAMTDCRHPMEAIEFLEAGRGVAMVALNELRTDTSSVASLSASQIEELISIRQELEESSSPLENRINVDNIDNVGDDLRKATRRIRAGQHFSEFVQKQYTRNHQMAFTDRITLSHLDGASRGGPIIVVNVSYRCDALLITGALTRPVSLPKLSRQAIQDRINEGNFTSEKTLEWLWDTIASPVLEALGFTGPPAPDRLWPRIWWIPIGPLSKFPLHAAGCHMESHSFNTVIDRVISSYASSIRSLDGIVSRRNRWRQGHQEGKSQALQALIVSMEHTPDSGRPLAYAVEEAQVVAKACRLMSVKTIQHDQCAKQTVLRHLQDSDIFHFAGHGYTDINDPSQSHLRLEDWKSDPLTVTDLFAINLRKGNPFLAYLGACGTGQIQGDIYLDESVHLISGCQLAGFRHLIGTLCRVQDKTCVEVARIVYDIICVKGITDDSVSEGLHQATRELRDRWRQDKQGPTWKVTIPPSRSRTDAAQTEDTREEIHEESLDIVLRDASDYESDEEADENVPLQWAPYVHYGC